MIEGLTPGVNVHYVINEKENRPAIVTKVLDPESGICNLVVFMDGPNDGFSASDSVRWIEKVIHDIRSGVDTWHFWEPV